MALAIAVISVMASDEALSAWLIAASVPLVVIFGIDQTVLLILLSQIEWQHCSIAKAVESVVGLQTGYWGSCV